MVVFGRGVVGRSAALAVVGWKKETPVFAVQCCAASALLPRRT